MEPAGTRLTLYLPRASSGLEEKRREAGQDQGLCREETGWDRMGWNESEGNSTLQHMSAKAPQISASSYSGRSTEAGGS